MLDLRQQSHLDRGHTELAFSEDVAGRFIAYGWNVTRVGDANDLERLERAFATFKNTTDRPTLIIVDSHIAYGSPNKQDTSAAHEPLGDEEGAAHESARPGWPENAKFLVPDGVREHFEEVSARVDAPAAPSGRTDSNAIDRRTDLAEQLFLMQHRELPKGWDDGLPVFPADERCRQP